jgi:hypothetical protein
MFMRLSPGRDPQEIIEHRTAVLIAAKQNNIEGKQNGKYLSSQDA